MSENNSESGSTQTPGSNVALSNSGATVTSTYSGNESFVVDGDTGSSHYWKPGGNNDSVTIGFPNLYRLESITIFHANMKNTDHFMIEFSADGANFTKYDNVTACSAALRRTDTLYACEFSTPIEAAYLRLTILDNSADIEIYEIQAIGHSPLPIPSSDSASDSTSDDSASGSDSTPAPTPTPTPSPDTDPTPIPDSDSSDSSCPADLVGFASVNADAVNGTTGGGDAISTTVTTLAELKAAAEDRDPRVIIVSGTIDTGSDPVSITSNKTLVGADKNATIKGGLRMRDVSNIIIRNLNIHGKWPGSAPADGIQSLNSHHIWYDHLNIWDAPDGLIDISRESNYQTISWTKFWYTDTKHDHRRASLAGGVGNADYGKIKVTYHHNWWADKVYQRMPRLAYGQGHVFNNYYNSPGDAYCITVGFYASALIENNYFKDVNSPHLFMYDIYAYTAAEGNIYDNTTGKIEKGTFGSAHVEGQESYKAEAFKPPYNYSLDEAKLVPDLVKRCAGPR